MKIIMWFLYAVIKNKFSINNKNWEKKMMTIDRKTHGYSTIKEDLERKVQKLNMKTQLLQKKVTGVNFYLKDVASLSKVKVPIQIEE